jgi:ankyrin repeat protein
MTVLHYAIFRVKYEIAHYFLSNGFEVNAQMSNDWTSLHLAIFLNLTDFVEMLSFFKAKVDIPDRYGVFLSLS